MEENDKFYEILCYYLIDIVYEYARYLLSIIFCKTLYNLL